MLYGEQIYLVHDLVTVPPEIVAGDTVTVTLPIHVFGPLYNQPYDPVVRLTDGQGRVVAERETWPGQRPEIAYFWMNYLTSEITLTVPLAATPGLYNVEIGFVGSEDGELLVAHSVPAAEEVGSVVPITTTVVVGE